METPSPEPRDASNQPPRRSSQRPHRGHASWYPAANYSSTLWRCLYVNTHVRLVKALNYVVYYLFTALSRGLPSTTFDTSGLRHRNTFLANSRDDKITGDKIPRQDKGSPILLPFYSRASATFGISYLFSLAPQTKSPAIYSICQPRAEWYGLLRTTTSLCPLHHTSILSHTNLLYDTVGEIISLSSRPSILPPKPTPRFTHTHSPIHPHCLHPHCPRPNNVNC